jgi:hypothetical protein
MFLVLHFGDYSNLIGRDSKSLKSQPQHDPEKEVFCDRFLSVSKA